MRGRQKKSSNGRQLWKSIQIPSDVFKRLETKAIMENVSCAMLARKAIELFLVQKDS